MIHDDKLARRSILGGAAALGAGAALAGCGGDDPPAGPGADSATLNALITAEYNAILAYDAGLQVLRNPPMGDPQASVAIILATIANNWKYHHEEHAAALVAAAQLIAAPTVERPTTFTPPAGFTASVANVLRLAANAERAAAIAYNNAVSTLTQGGNKFLAGSILGDETQHFIVLYSLLKGLAGPGSNIVTGTGDVVPKAFVSTITPVPATPAAVMAEMRTFTGQGLQTVMDLPYT